MLKTTILGESTGAEAPTEDSTVVQSSSFDFFADNESAEEIAIPAEEVRTPIACYKNKAYRRFQMGPFDFKNHLLYIYSEAENEAFLTMHRELPPIERNAIVAYNFKALSNLERPVNSTAVRGITSSTNIKDPKVLG